MQLVHSLTTALPLSRLTAYKPKGHYHTFGEPQSTHALSSSTAHPSSSRTLPRTSTIAHTQKHADLPPSASHAASHPAVQTKSAEEHVSQLPPDLLNAASHPPVQTRSAQEHISQLPPDLPNAARLNANINPQPSTTILEVSLAFPATTYYLTTIAPEVNLHPGDKNQPSVYLSGSLVVSGSIDATATAPDVVMGGSWEGVVASSSMSSRVAVMATASVSLPDTKAATTSSGVLIVDVPTPSVTASVSFGSVEAASNTSAKSKLLTTSRSIASSTSTSKTNASSGSASKSAASNSSSSSSVTPKSKSSNTKSSSMESTPTTSATSTSTSTSTSREEERTLATSTTSSRKEENPAPHWWRRFRGRRNDEEGIYQPSRHVHTHSESHPTGTTEKRASFATRIMTDHSEIMLVAPLPTRTTTEMSATSINELCERQTGGSTYECPEVLTNGSS